TLVTLVQPPRTLVWTGANGTGFASAANWNDLTNAVDPAILAPNETDTAAFVAGRGTITGVGTALALWFDGGAAWNVTNSASLTAVSGVTVGGADSVTVLIDGGASVSGSGSADEISGGPGALAEVTIEGAGSAWRSAGALIVGDFGAGAVVVRSAA